MDDELTTKKAKNSKTSNKVKGKGKTGTKRLRNEGDSYDNEDSENSDLFDDVSPSGKKIHDSNNKRSVKLLGKRKNT